ncbi:unnamed protein product, partial [Discosporangium mesarthrocarpum]
GPTGFEKKGGDAETALPLIPCRELGRGGQNRGGQYFGNDPSASPTETLLRLHLPLNDEV